MRSQPNCFEILLFEATIVIVIVDIVVVVVVEDVVVVDVIVALFVDTGHIIGAYHTDFVMGGTSPLLLQSKFLFTNTTMLYIGHFNI